ncbi:hypothetical protein C923_01404 [Plasmodium falciparum UGT5.1]|uniref:Uncharacterized protein n=1 Tax=Plasmodium falciparum UGT5.1 TaxID=1237627 RepID=W7JSL6_PLAFA|nr:hypothetical protein C923_01404 [Plasmodium falciparum UGT5.1]
MFYFRYTFFRILFSMFLCFLYYYFVQLSFLLIFINIRRPILFSHPY